MGDTSPFNSGSPQAQAIAGLFVWNLAIAAVIFVLGSSEIEKKAGIEAGPPVPAGIAPNDALVMRNLEGWRVATTEDFPPEATTFLNGYGEEARGVIEGDFSGSGRGDDVAYILTNDRHQFRLLVIASHATRYDAEFPSLGFVARIPKDSAGSVQWNGAPPAAMNGDGLLIVTNAQDRASGMALFLGPERIASAAPADFQTLSLR